MIGPVNPVATSHGRSGSRSGHRHRLLIPVRTPAAGSGTGAYAWRVVGLGFPTRRFPPRSCSPGLPPGRFLSCWGWEHSLLCLFSQSLQTRALALNQGNRRPFPFIHRRSQLASRRTLGTRWAGLLMRFGVGHPCPSSQPSQASSPPLSTGPPRLGSTTVARAKPFLPSYPGPLLRCSAISQRRSPHWDSEAQAPDPHRSHKSL